MRYRLAIALLALMPAASQATDVPASILTNTTWTKAGSPYRLKGRVQIQCAKVLTIEPGVDVLFDAGGELAGDCGHIHAVGTATDSIRFLPGTAVTHPSIKVGGFTESLADSFHFAWARFSGGNSTSNGGGIKVSGTGVKLTLDHCVISGNTTTVEGGGICNDGGAILRMTNCTIRGNSAASGGAISFRQNCTAYISDCVISGNTASSDGAAIFGGSVTAMFTRCLITGNTPATKNTIDANSSAKYTFVHCTIADNATGTTKVFDSTSGGKATLRNTIVWGSGTVMLEPALPGTTNPWTVSHCDIKSAGVDTAGIISADPLFAGAGDYTLQAGSPCINAGNPADPQDTDGTCCDIGAYPRLGPVAVS